MGEQLFYTLTREPNLSRADLVANNATHKNALVFDSSYQMLYTKGNKYFEPRVAPWNYSHNAANAPFLSDTINENNSMQIVGPYTTYALYINPRGEITIVDYVYYQANKTV